MGLSLLAMVWRRTIFSLGRRDLGMVLAIQIFRVLITTVLTALAWHIVLPQVQIGWWLVLSAIRLLVSRLHGALTLLPPVADRAILKLHPSARVRQQRRGTPFEWMRDAG